MLNARWAVRAVARWEAEQYRGAHDAAGAEPMADATAERLADLLEDSMQSGFAEPEVVRLYAGPEPAWPIETTDELDTDALNRHCPLGQVLRSPPMAIELRWWPDRVEARVDGSPAWETVADAGVLGPRRLFGED